MIGAGPCTKINDGTKILKILYKQAIVTDNVYTMYVQANGIESKAWRKYDRNLTKDSKGVVQEADARLERFDG